jgi:hypothetical protein
MKWPVVPVSGSKMDSRLARVPGVGTRTAGEPAVATNQGSVVAEMQWPLPWAYLTQMASRLSAKRYQGVGHVGNRA